jgi:hypothetical protein
VWNSTPLASEHRHCNVIYRSEEKRELNELLKREIYCYVFRLEIDSWVIAGGVRRDGEREVRRGKKEVGVMQGATRE